MAKNVFESPIEKLESIVTIKEIFELQEAVKSVHIAPNINQYIVNIVSETRNLPGDVKLGASPRASLALMNTSRALAFLNKRDFVIPEDIKKLAYPVLNHRLILHPRSVVRGLTSEHIVSHILGKIPIPA